MADGRDETPAFSFRKAFRFTEIFRCFQVALDPRKLLVAALGILVMSLGWYLLSTIFYYDRPIQTAEQYTSDSVLARKYPRKPDGTETTAEDRQRMGQEEFERDFAQWRVLDELAGPGGRLRTMPWYEYRGPNPYLFATQLAGSPSPTWAGRIWNYVTDQAPVLAEPLVKFLLPVVRIIDPNASPQTRFYLLLVILWSVATWAFFGGVITRIAAVQLSGKDRVSLRQAVEYVASRYLSYLISPLVPLGIIAVVAVGLMLYGFLALIPIVGDLILYGLGFPLVILGGIVMTILLVGLVGYPMMYTTLSAEGSDTFDALSRSYNYVFQAPWQYLWYGVVAVLYGAAVTFFVILVASMMVYLGKWAISQAPLSEYTNQRPDYLFVYAPESFGWKELLLRGTPIEVREDARPTDSGRVLVTYPYTDQARADKYKVSYQGWNRVGAGMVTFWLVALFLMMLGFSYSFFWTAMTMIYLLMRRRVDEVELDEVYLEDEAPEAPVAPPPSAATTAPAGPGVSSLPMVPPPPAAPLPPPSAVQYTGPAATTGGQPALPPPPPPPPTTTSTVVYSSKDDGGTSTTDGGRAAGGPEKTDAEAKKTDGEKL